MTVYNKLDHMISEAKCLSRSATNRANESLMYDIVFSLEKAKKNISEEDGNAKYNEDKFYVRAR